MNSALIIPFLITFFIPGILAALLVRGNRETDLLLFIVYAALAGFAMQILITVVAGIIPFFENVPVLRVGMAALSVIGVLMYCFLRKKERGNITRITVSSYDIATIVMSCVLGLILRAQMAGLPMPYFNTGSDQYYWLAYAERATYDFGTIASLIIRDAINQTAFFFVLVPYTAFLPKNLAAYQSFMALWQYGVYALATVALSRLAYAALPFPSMGILAPSAMYMLHWVNYYMISTDIVPQNTALFFLIAGCILLHERIRVAEGIAFILLFYCIHLPTLALFILIVGTAKIAVEGIRIVVSNIRKREWTADWHIFESIAFAPTCVVIFFYGLYAGGILHPYPSGLISYFEEYAKNLTLQSQPYTGAPQQIILWLAILGTALVPVYAYCSPKKRRLLVALGFAFLLPWGFLVTPLIAYHAFYASWQSFRYYLIMYPAIGVLAFLPPAAMLVLIERFISKNLAAAAAIALIIIYAPLMMKLTAEQQGKVILDMIIGRDGGISFSEQKKSIREFLSINETTPPGSLVSVGPALMTPYMQWVFAPRAFFASSADCSERACMVYDAFAHTTTEVWNVPHPILGLIQKGIPAEAGARAVFEKLFSEWQETETYFIYRNALPQ